MPRQVKIRLRHPEGKLPNEVEGEVYDTRNETLTIDNFSRSASVSPLFELDLNDPLPRGTFLLYLVTETHPYVPLQQFRIDLAGRVVRLLRVRLQD